MWTGRFACCKTIVMHFDDESEDERTAAIPVESLADVAAYWAAKLAEESEAS